MFASCMETLHFYLILIDKLQPGFTYLGAGGSQLDSGSYFTGVHKVEGNELFGGTEDQVR